MLRPLAPQGQNLLLPVVPLRDVCLFPEASLSRVINRTYNIRALEVAARTGKRVLALGRRDPDAVNPGPDSLYDLGTVADLVADEAAPVGGRRIELDGLQRARVVGLYGVDTVMAEVALLGESKADDEAWGGAVEALARYLHGKKDLRAFLDGERRSKEPMAWVNLACQHLPISASARQKLLEADAGERCVKIGRGLDALLRKEQSS